MNKIEQIKKESTTAIREALEEGGCDVRLIGKIGELLLICSTKN